jgi:hypothetical protein
MANEVIASTARPAGQQVLARFEGSFNRLRSAQSRIFHARKAIGLTTNDAELPLAPDLPTTSDGFLQQLEAIASAFDEMSKEICVDADQIAAAFA